MLAAIILFAVAGLCLVIGFAGRLHSRRRAVVVAGWPTVDGVVTSTDVVDASSSGPRYLPWITYNYEVAGTAYEGDRLRLGGRVMFQSRAKALDYLARFPSHGRVKVYYDPKQPARSLLDPSPQSYVFVVFAIFAAVAGFVGLIILVAAVTSNG